MNRKIGILGAGSWGTALAIMAARNGCETLLWGRNAEKVRTLAEQRENRQYLPGITFPENLTLTSSIRDACKFSDVLLLSVPSHAFREILSTIRPFWSEQMKIAWATKGLDPESGGFLHEAASQILGPDTPAAILSGPTFAREVATGLPTAITVASKYQAFSMQLSSLLHSERFRIYTSEDIIGVQTGGAVKNVLAIAAGIADGLGFGANTRAALITRGLQEIMRLTLALGGKSETIMGLSGLGDLILTCTDNQSRNRRFGIALGKGEKQEEITRDIGQEIEGIKAAREAFNLAKKHQLELPIIEQTFKVLYENLSALNAVHNLLHRKQKAEIIV